MVEFRVLIRNNTRLMYTQECVYFKVVQNCSALLDNGAAGILNVQ